MPTEIELEQQEVVLKKEQKDELINTISSYYSTWMDELKPHQERYKELIKHIFIDTTSDKVKSDFAYIMPGIYKRFLTYIAHMVTNIYPSAESSFDVSGEDFESSKNIGKQKALLVKELKNMDYYQVLNKYLIDRALKGETVRYIDWEIKKKKVRRKLSYIEKKFNEIYSMFSGELNENKFETIEIEEYRGARIHNIDPHSFVFDKNLVDEWKNCPKIYRTLSTYQELKTNKVYSELKGLETIENLSPEKRESSNTQGFGDESKSVENGKIELLHFWGDLKLNDGTYLTDYCIVIAGRKNIIRFEPNPYPFCPIRRSSFLDDPETGRSISMFDAAVPLNVYNSDTYQKMQKAVRLVADRPAIAPNGLLKKSIIEVEAGMVITYESNATSPDQKPEFLDYSQSLNTISQMLPLTSSEIESTTGIFDNMLGLNATGNRTATEMSMVGQGQDKRMLNELKDISREIIVKDIEDIAELNASNRDESIEVKVSNITGSTGYEQIDENTWNGQYSYTYGDSLGKAERQYKLKENMALMQDMIMLPAIQSEIGGGMLELFKWLLTQMDMDNADSLIESMQQKTMQQKEGMINEQIGTPQANTGIQGIEMPPRL